MHPSERMSECNANYDHDTLSEILMRLDPDTLFKSILVSKDWLSVISDPVFRTNYHSRWKDSISSQVVGILLSDVKDVYRRSPGNHQLLATSNFGRNMNARNSFPDINLGFFYSKSLKGGLLLFGGIEQPSTLYVCKPSSGSPPVKLPDPIYTSYAICLAMILCDDDDGRDYKVILGSTGNLRPNMVVGIQTFCSKAWKWEQYQPSKLKCYNKCLYMISRLAGGITSSRGIIYCRARCESQGKTRNCLVSWDKNGVFAGVILNPPLIAANSTILYSGYAITYGMSSSSSVLAATTFTGKYSKQWESEWYTIDIWCLDEDKREWDSLYSVRHASIWSDNSSLLGSLFEARPKSGFVLVSFVSGKSDTVLLALKRQLFIYHFPTGKLERMEYLKYGALGFEYPRLLDTYDPEVTYHPLTLQDLGVWPSSPPSLRH